MTLQDLRFALRQLRRAPAFAVAAILTLALGVGANTAVFSLLDQALLRSLPVRDPVALVVLEGTGTAWEGHSSSQGGDEAAYFSYPMYRDLRDRNAAFSGLIATAPAQIGFSRNGHAEAVRAEIVSGNYFTVLGVQPALGQLFTQAADTRPEADPVAVVSFDFWRDHLGADPSILGTTASINGHPFQLIGVAAPRFRSAVWGETPAVFVPMAMQNEVLPGQGKRLIDHTDKWMNILGRLKPGVSRAQAAASMQPLWHALRAEELKALGHRSPHFVADFLTDSRLRVLPGARGFSYQREAYQTPLLAVMAMALLVLGIAAVNVASLLLVRSAGRVREFSLRYALGAGYTRLTAQLLLEGLLIGFAGGLAGMLLAPVAIRAIIHQLANDQTDVAFSTAVDARLLVFSLLLALAVSVFFSLAPALGLRRPDLASALRQSASTATGGTLTLRHLMVSLQIGLSVLLLVGAGLFVRTMAKLRAVDVGFNTAHLVTFGFNAVLSGTPRTAIPGLQQHVIATLAALPGVQSVAASSLAELAGDDHGGNITVAGYVPTADDDFDVEKQFVNPAFSSTLGIPMLAGRAFTDADRAGAQQVAVVNEAFVRHFCSGDIRSCLGRQVGDGGGDRVKLNTQIVGVVRDAKHKGLREPADPTLYRPLLQDPSPAQLFLYLRTATPPEQLLPTVRRTMAQLAPSLALVDLRTVDMQIDDSLLNERMITLLAVTFGLLALLLAGVGLYGVLAFTAGQRTREIGIRIALGSSRGAVSRMVFAEVLCLAAAGVGVALPVAFGLARLLRSQLYGVSAADPLTLVAVLLLMASTALLAALLPAHRAATVDPSTALRAE